MKNIKKKVNQDYKKIKKGVKITKNETLEKIFEK